MAGGLFLGDMIFTNNAIHEVPGSDERMEPVPTVLYTCLKNLNTLWKI